MSATYDCLACFVFVFVQLCPGAMVAFNINIYIVQQSFFKHLFILYYDNYFDRANKIKEQKTIAQKGGAISQGMAQTAFLITSFK